MRVIFSNGDLLTQGGHLHLVPAGPHWLVVGRGFVCQVHNPEEGMSVIARLRADGEPRGVQIDLWRPPVTLTK